MNNEDKDLVKEIDGLVEKIRDQSSDECSVPDFVDEITEENMDGLIYIVRGIGMMYNSSIDNRNTIRDLMDNARRANPEMFKTFTLNVINEYVESFTDLMAAIVVVMKIIEKRGKNND